MTKKKPALKKKAPDKLSKAEADNARDATLKTMLRTPPKKHKDEPPRATGSKRPTKKTS